MLKLQTQKELKNQHGKLIIIAGPSGSGKTTLLISEFLRWYSEIPLISLEMSYFDLYSHYKKDITKLKIYNGDCNLNDIKNLAYLHKILLIDYLQLMSDFSHKTTRILKQIALETQCDIYAISQLNDKNLTYGSRTIKQDANQLWIINKKDQTLTLEKNRSGYEQKTFSLNRNSYTFSIYDSDTQKFFYLPFSKQDPKLLQVFETTQISKLSQLKKPQSQNSSDSQSISLILNNQDLKCL